MIRSRGHLGTVDSAKRGKKAATTPEVGANLKIVEDAVREGMKGHLFEDVAPAKTVAVDIKNGVVQQE